MPNQYPEVYTQFFANIIIVSILISLIVSILFLYQKKRLSKEKEIEAIKINYERALLQTQVEIQEEVLKNIAMELHDNIGQVLLLANINVAMIQKMEGIPLQADNLITDTKKILGTACEDISTLSRSLHSDRIKEIGVFQAILKDLKQLERKELFSIIIHDDIQDDIILPFPTQLMLFRMFQEIIKNIIKHANASLVTFNMAKQDNQLELKFTDNGIGFEYDPDNKHLQNGIGIKSLKSRAEYFNGKVRINSILEKGTEVSIVIPLS